MSAAPVAKLTVEEFLAAERAADLRNEYHDGEVFPLVAAGWNHGVITGNCYQAASARLKGTSCRLSVSAVKVRVSPTKLVVPDLVVVCGRPAFTDEASDVITNPKVVLEVLSPSTRNYDRGDKFDLYRLLPSFEEYVLIAQDEAKVEVIRRHSDGRWVITFCQGTESVAQLESLDISLPLAELYAGVFDEATGPATP